MAKIITSVLVFEDDNGPRQDWRDDCRTAMQAAYAAGDWEVLRDDATGWSQDLADEFTSGQMTNAEDTPALVMVARFTGDEGDRDPDNPDRMVWEMVLDGLYAAEANHSNGQYVAQISND